MTSLPPSPHPPPPPHPPPQSDLAQLRASLSGLHAEYAELAKRAARSGVLTAAAVEELVDARLHGPVMDALLTKKVGWGGGRCGEVWA